MHTFKGVPPAPRTFRECEGIVWIPYMEFKIENPVKKLYKKFWVDVYFIDKLDLVVRRAALLREPVESIRDVEAPLDSVVLKPCIDSVEKLYELLYEAYTYSIETLKAKSLERATKLSRWSQLKNFLIPIGYTRHLRRDDVEASIVRESIRAREILREALMLEENTEACRGNVVSGGGTYWYPIVFEKKRDTIIALDGADEKLRVHNVYTRLLEMDERAKTALIESIGKLTF